MKYIIINPKSDDSNNNIKAFDEEKDLVFHLLFHTKGLKDQVINFLKYNNCD